MSRQILHFKIKEIVSKTSGPLDNSAMNRAPAGPRSLGHHYRSRYEDRIRALATRVDKHQFNCAEDSSPLIDRHFAEHRRRSGVVRRFLPERLCFALIKGKIKAIETVRACFAAVCRNRFLFAHS